MNKLLMDKMAGSFKNYFKKKFCLYQYSKGLICKKNYEIDRDKSHNDAQCFTKSHKDLLLSS